MKTRTIRPPKEQTKMNLSRPVLSACYVVPGGYREKTRNLTALRWTRLDLNHQSISEYEIDEKHRADAEQYAKRNAGQQEKVSVVGTASYQHTLMRVRTMSEPALKNRVKAIERAKGKHAVVKMRLFARVLFLEGVEEVMEDAAAALERLVKELGDPEEEEE